MSVYRVDLAIVGDPRDVEAAYDVFMRELKRRHCGYEGSIVRVEPTQAKDES